jgi:hypothetical protein
MSSNLILNDGIIEKHINKKNLQNKKSKKIGIKFDKKKLNEDEI